MASEPAKPGSDTTTDTKTGTETKTKDLERKPGEIERELGTGGEPGSELKRAIDRPIGQPERAREEAPIGWDFGPDGNPLWADPYAGGSVPESTSPEARDLSSRAERTPVEESEDGGRAPVDGRPELDARPVGSIDKDDFDQAPRPEPGDHVGGGSVTPLDPGTTSPLQPRPPGPAGPDIGGPGGAGSGGSGDEPSDRPGGGGTDQPTQVRPPPVASGDAAGHVTEDTAPSTAGQLVAVSSDGGGMVWSVIGPGGGRLGSFQIDPGTGQWTYTLDDRSQSLREGQTAQEIFTVRAVDGTGAYVDQRVVVTVTGTNDVPVISGVGTGAVVEDGTQTASGTLVSSDVDVGDSATWGITGDGHGSYGVLSVDQNGNWTYALDNDAAQGLRAGETRTDIFQVTVTDSAGATATHEVSVTIAGVNDAPAILVGSAWQGVTEDDVLSTNGQLGVADNDIGDTMTWSVADDHGAYGQIEIDESGRWTYTLDNDAAQGLRAGETRTDIFQVIVTDSAGATATQEIIVTVTGTNDAPVISGVGTGMVAEDEILTASGKLDASDADIGDSATWSITGSDHRAYGALAVDQNGAWTYTLDNDAAQGLKAGETRTDIFQVTVTDSTGATATHEVSVTITGTNDAPVISGIGTGVVTEDDIPTASGKLDVGDADIGDSATWSIGNDHGAYGDLTIDQNGHWTYTLDNDTAQGLKVSESHTDIFQVTVTDSAGATATHEVSVTVTGTNDAPVISGIGTGVVTEDEIPTASGTLDVSDADVGDSAIWSVGNDHGAYGSITVDDSGHWTYTLDNDAAQGLKAGETRTDIFQVTVTDSAGATATHEVSVTITGTNDAPVISGTATGAVTEDEVPTATGKLDTSDADIGDSATWSIGDNHGSYGNLTVDQNGNWTYTLDNDAAQGLKAGEIRTDIFQVTVTDSAGATATHEVSVTITGTNDAPVISGIGTGVVTEDEIPTASGTLDVSDADIGDGATWSVGNDHGSYGNLAVDQNGNWTYTLDNDAAQGLKAGETRTDIFQVTVTDGAGATATHEVSVIVTGTNDVPVISGTGSGAVTEDEVSTASGRLDASDADIGDSATWSIAGSDHGSYGNLTVDQTGAWTYTLDNDAAQGLKAGETRTDIFRVVVTDSAGATATHEVSVTITGTNDAPVISGIGTGVVTEDEIPTASGTLDVSDADIGDTATWSVGNDHGTYGSIAVDDSGHWTYTLDNDAAQGLRAGETRTDIFQVTVTDSAGATATHEVSVTIMGTNDVPVISGTGSGAVTEDEVPTTSGTLISSDADIGDTATWSVGNDHGAYGSIAVDDSGHWTYTLDNDAAQGLKAGETRTDIFQVVVTDSAGATATHEVSVTIMGTNDVPVISGIGTGVVTEDEIPTASGTLDVSDADIGDTATWSVGNDHGAYGSIAVDDSGHWTYTLDNDAAQGLKAGEIRTDIFQVVVTDSAGATATHEVSVTITGTNDVPVISGTGSGAVTEDEVPTTSGTLISSDADIGDTATWSVGKDHGVYGSIAVDDSGHWTYTLDNDAAQGLKAGETRTDIFQVVVTDSAGATATHEVSVTITGTNDVPVISGVATGAVTEDVTPSASGKLISTDVDSGDTAAWTVVNDGHGNYGSLSVDQNGNWTYTLDDRAQALAAGETRQDVFTVHVTDSAGAVAEQQVMINVAGTNDAPVVESALAFSMNEDGTITISDTQFLQGASDIDSPTLSVANLVVNGGVGELSGPDEHGYYTYRPPHDFSGDITLSYDVTDGQAYTHQTATIDVIPEADAPELSVSVGPGTEVGGAGGGGTGSGTDPDLGIDVSVTDPGHYDQTGTEGSDWIRAGEGDNAIKAGAGDDTIYGDMDYQSSGKDYIDAGAGNDTVTGGDDSDQIVGGEGNDTIYADFQNVSSNPGNDVVDAGAGNDIVVGGDGDDKISGGSGDDTLYGDFDYQTKGGNDQIDAGEGNDVVIGGAGNDVIAGGDGNDTIYGDYRWNTGDDGDDRIAGGKGDDTIYGGGGKDTLVLEGSRDEYQITQNPDGSFTIVDTVAGRDGTDTAYDIENFSFADGDVPASDILTGGGTGETPGIRYPVDITTGLTDTDGSETLSNIVIDLSNVPAGTTFSAGSEVDGNWVLTPDQLPGLTMTVPKDAPPFDLNVSVTSTESADGDSRTTSVSVQVGGPDAGSSGAGGTTEPAVTTPVSDVDHAPVIAGTSTGDVKDESPDTTASGQLTATDPDAGDTATWDVVNDGKGAYGDLVIDENGNWTYTLDDDTAQGLKEGQTAQDIFTVTATDQSGATTEQQVTVTVTGTNDAPVISGVSTGEVKDGEVATAGGQLVATDPDVGDTATWAVINDGQGTYGELTIDPDGHWSYTLDGDSAQGLKEGQTAQEVFTVTATDESGATVEHQVTVTVTGTNDAPVITGTFAGEVTEDEVMTASGRLTATDPDIGDTATWSVADDGYGSYGQLTLDQDGHWSYALDNASAQGLRAGQTTQDVFTVRVTDSAGAVAEHQIAVTVTGTNDAPVITGTYTGAAQEDVTLMTSGTLNAADADIGDQATWSIDGAATSGYGTLAIDPETGHWVYTLNNDAAQSLQDGQVVHEAFTVRATDTAGASVSQVVSIDVTGTNDVPQVSPGLNSMGNMKEDTSITFTTDDLLKAAQVADVDHDALRVTSVTLDASSASTGTLVDNHDGTWTYTPGKNVSGVTPQINFSVDDGHQTVGAHASVAVQPVADPATVSITAGTVRDVINTGSADDLGRIVVSNLTTTAPTEFTLEFTVLGKSVPESTTGAGPVIVNIGSPPSDKNTLTLWDPANMKVGMSKAGGGDVNIATGINLADGESHRVTLTWDAKTNSLKVYDNGTLELTTTPPKAFPGNLYMSIAEKANTPPTTANPAGGGYRANEHFEGTIFNVAMADKAETAAQVKAGPLAEQMQDNLLIDVRAEDNRIVDTTGKHAISAVGGLHQDTVPVDSSLASVPAGATLHVDISSQLGDSHDTITHLEVSGFVAGTVLSDGTHTVTVASPSDKIDITTWSQDSLMAKLPDGVHQNMDLQVSATTSTPAYATGEVDANGQPVMASDSATSTTDHLIYVEGATTTAQPAATLRMAVAAPATTTDDASADGVAAAAAVLTSAVVASDAEHAATAQSSDQQQTTTDHATDTDMAASSGSDESGTAVSPETSGVVDAQADAAAQVAASDVSGGSVAASSATVSSVAADTQVASAAPAVARTDQVDSGAAAATDTQAQATATVASATAVSSATTTSSEAAQQAPAQEAVHEATSAPDASVSAQDAASAAGAETPASGGAAVPIAASAPVDATGQVTLVSVNDWYNPSWGGGYNATFQLTLTEDMLRGDGVEGWSLQVGLNNPDAVVSAGWLNGFNGTVSFDPATGTFTNAEQDYKPELHAGDTIQFSVQVQNTGFNMADISFSYKDLDPVPEATPHGGSADLGTTSLDGSVATDSADTQAASVSADIIAGEHGAQDLSHPANTTDSDQPAAAHTDAAVGTGDGDAGTTHDTDQGQAPDIDHGMAVTPPDSQGTSASDDLATPVTESHAPDQVAAGPESADQGAGDAALQAQASLTSSPSTAGAYLELVQAPADDHAPTLQPAEHDSSNAADYVQMATGAEQSAQEPPPPDHLFADAQVEHGSVSGNGTPDEQPQLADHDAAAAAAAAAPEPVSIEHDQSHQGV